jgi:hypothetical protein
MQNIISEEKEGVYVHCSNTRCNYRWRYKGQSTFYASCPYCRRNVKISENKTKSLQSAQVDRPVQTTTVATTTTIPKGQSESPA